MAATDAFTGVLPIDKPAGPTSHDMVARARRALRTRRIGHTGTLDPFATGLLLLCIGAATRLAEYLNDLPKRYRATLRLGVATTTDDLTGDIVATSDDWQGLDERRIREALGAQTGTLLQLPPAYSAKRIDGARAYDLARKGIAASLQPATVRVDAIDIVRIEPPDVEFDVTCSAGTYIRAIARDAGADLGTGGHLLALRRTAIGPHTVEHALPADRLDDGDAVAAAMLTPLDAVSHLARVEVDNAGRTALAHGRAISVPDRSAGTAAVSHQGELVAIAQVAHGSLIPRKVFVHA